MLYEHTEVCGSRRIKRVLIVSLLVASCFALLTVARPPAASANIPYPYQFMPHIEPYQTDVDRQAKCSVFEKPGVVGFRDLLNFWFGHHAYGIVLGCDPANPTPGDEHNEHKEGRALDYMVPATDPTAQRIINWVLNPDEYGHPNAFGRRFGLMYIVWNRKIFRFYPPVGWGEYTGLNPHTDHIHFSFTWPGAEKKTSWWTTTQQTRSGCGSSVQTWTWASTFGPLVQIKRIQDYYGSVFDTQSEIRNSYWRVRGGGQQYFANQALSIYLSPRPQGVMPLISGGACYVNLTG
jgi:hypothetical protein